MSVCEQTLRCNHQMTNDPQKLQAIKPRMLLVRQRTPTDHLNLGRDLCGPQRGGDRPLASKSPATRRTSLVEAFRMVRLCIASIDPIKLSSQCVMCNRRQFPVTVIECTGITKVNELISSPLTVQEATCLIYNCRRQVPEIKPEPYHGSVSHAARANFQPAASVSRNHGILPTPFYDALPPPEYLPLPLAAAGAPHPLLRSYGGGVGGGASLLASPSSLMNAAGGVFGGGAGGAGAAIGVSPLSLLRASRQPTINYAIVPASYAASPFGSRFKTAFLPSPFK